MSALFIIFLLAPAVLIYLCRKLPALDKLGVVMLAFGAGFLIALAGDLHSWFGKETTEMVQKNLSETSVAIALPLLLFSMNVKQALKDSGLAFKAMCLSLLSVVLASLIGVLLFKAHVPDLWQVAGMSVGAYTGSGANMGAVKTGINGDHAIFLSMITYDIVFSSFYMLFVITIGPRIAALFLKPFHYEERESEKRTNSMEHLAEESANAYVRIVDRQSVRQSGIALICSGVVVGLSVVLASFLPDHLSSTMTIILITTFGILGSFIPQIHNLKTSFHMGMYLILVFCVTSASMMDMSIITDMDFGIGAYIGFILVASLLLHGVFCKAFGIDRDTYLITSGAAVMSVPFIPVIAGALKNREILVPGFAVAILGYALGNYLGIAVALSAKNYF